MPNQDTMQIRVHGADAPCILHLSTREQYIPQFDSNQHEKNNQQSASETFIPCKVWGSQSNDADKSSGTLHCVMGKWIYFDILQNILVSEITCYMA